MLRRILLIALLVISIGFVVITTNAHIPRDHECFGRTNCLHDGFSLVHIPGTSEFEWPDDP